MTRKGLIMKLLQALGSNEIAQMISEGKTAELVAHTQRYEEQQRKIAAGLIKTQRVCCKPNKNGNLYLQHPSIKTKSNQMNLNSTTEPVVFAIAFDDELREMVKAYYQRESYVEEYRAVEQQS